MRARLLAVVVALGLVRGASACVDGVTPDCSVASVCAPIYGDAAPTPFDDDVATDAGHDANASPRDAIADSTADADGG